MVNGRLKGENVIVLVIARQNAATNSALLKPTPCSLYFFSFSKGKLQELQHSDLVTPGLTAANSGCEGQSLPL